MIYFLNHEESLELLLDFLLRLGGGDLRRGGDLGGKRLLRGGDLLRIGGGGGGYPRQPPPLGGDGRLGGRRLRIIGNTVRIITT